MLSIFRPRVLYRYILMEYLKSLALAVLACSFCFLLATLFFRATEMEDFNIGIGQLLILAPFFAPYAMTFTLPLAAMIAAILVFGRLSAENEILAAQSGGASMGTLSLPLLGTGLLLSLCTLWLNEVGLEWGYAQFREHVMNLENPELIARLREPGNSVSVNLSDGGVLHVNMLHPGTGQPPGERPLHIAYFLKGRKKMSVFARHHEFSQPYRGKPPENRLRMDVRLYRVQCLGTFLSETPKYLPEPEKNPKFFESSEFSLDLPSLTDLLHQGSGQESLLQNLGQARALLESIGERRQLVVQRAADLAAHLVSGSPADPFSTALTAATWMKTQQAAGQASAARKKALQKMVEFHRKLALSMMPLCLVVFGVGLGLLVRKSNRLAGFVLGVLAYFLIYYPAMVVFKELANAGKVAPAFLWLPNLLVVLLGWALWVGFERGRLLTLPSWAYSSGSGLERLVQWLWRTATRLDLASVMPFPRAIDRHVAAVFVTPLLAISVAAATLYILLDLVEHGGEVIRGVALAGQPLLGLPARGPFQALLDVGLYYGIRGLHMLFTLLPAILLMAGVFAVTIMVRNNEHLILKSSGQRLQRAFQPLLFLAGLLSLSVAFTRESVMPVLAMHQDRLKPLIYHRSPKTQSMAGISEDAQGQPVIYEIEKYSRNRQVCEGLQLYLPEESAAPGILPMLCADSASWNHEQQAWELRILNAKTGAVSDQSLEGTERRYSPYGLKLTSRPGKASHLAELGTQKTPTFEGMLSPAYLEFENLGPAAMRLTDLWQYRHRPEFASELWRRAFDWLTGILLIMVSIPALVRQEVRSPLIGITRCTLYGALYLGLNMGLAEAARQATIPAWAPALPHLAFLGLALWRYQLRMET